MTPMFASAQLSQYPEACAIPTSGIGCVSSQRRALSVEWYVCREDSQGIDGDDMHVYHAPTECTD
jgi:hypothetical protein